MQHEIPLLEALEKGNLAVSLTRSWANPNIIDLHITPKEATKEYAVHELCKILNVDQEFVVGIGDGHNDIHLFNAVGYKVAMGNAENELKHIADEIIEPFDSDGLAKYIMSISEMKAMQ